MRRIAGNGRLLPRLCVIVALIQGAAGSLAWAVTPDEMLADPRLEARARALSQQLRCVVCQNQSIDDSNAPLARDLRVLVRERLKNGASDTAALDFIVARYGNFVLLKPPLQANTMLLWLGPALLLLTAVGAVAAYLRGRARHLDTDGPPALSSQDQKRLARILEGHRS